MAEKLNEIYEYAKNNYEKNDNKKCKVLILNRIGKKRRIRYAGLIKKYEKNKHMKVEFKTIHSCKGLTFDFVFLDDVSIGILGFPCNKSDDSILKMFLNNTESFPYAEERRLFYVAMTRAKKRVYIMYRSYTASIFVEEINEILDINCDDCGGVMNYNSEYSFFGCQNYPKCSFTINEGENKYEKMAKLIVNTS